MMKNEVSNIKSIRNMIYDLLVYAEKFVDYFKKDAFIQVDYIYYEDEGSGEYKKKPDSFNIYIVSRGKAKSLWRKIDWVDSDKLIETLKKLNQHVKIDMDVRMGTSSLLIPKWAQSKIIDELEKVKLEYHEIGLSLGLIGGD